MSIFDEDIPGWSPEEDDDNDEHLIQDVTVFPNVIGHITRGKYKGISLPRMLNVKPRHVEKVEALKQEIIADPAFQRHAVALAAEYAALRREQTAIMAMLSDCNLRLEAVTEIMCEQFEVESATSISLEHGVNVNVQAQPHTVVTDKEAFRVWCITDGLSRLMTLPWGTANKLVKAMLLEGKKEPDGVQAFFRNKVVFKKGDLP